jgi:Zn-dependent protease with chaperone function
MPPGKPSPRTAAKTPAARTAEKKKPSPRKPVSRAGKKPAVPKPPPRKRDAEAQWSRATRLDPALFQHPEDAAAREKLETVPGFELLTRKILEFGAESLYHGLYMGNCVRLSPTQLPDIYNLLPPVCRAFGIDEPEFYLQMNPGPNAWTMGDTRIFLVVTSGLLEHMEDPAERQAVIAHECGHIVCRHNMYAMMARLLASLGTSFFGVLRPLAKPIQIALDYWSRRSELSADRAAAIWSGGPDPMVRALFRISGGPSAITSGINVEEFAAQARAYDELQENSQWHKLLQSYAVMNANHPFTAVRVRELLKWKDDDGFAAARRAIAAPLPAEGPACPSCGRPHAPRQKFCRHCGAKLA